MDPDALISIAGNYLVAFFFLISPLLLARRWFPSATRMIESVVWPVIIGIAAVAILGALLPYLIMVIVPVLILAVAVGIGLALYLHQSGGRQRRQRRGKKQPGRIQPIRRPAGRQRQQRRRT